MQAHKKMGKGLSRFCLIFVLFMQGCSGSGNQAHQGSSYLASVVAWAKSLVGRPSVPTYDINSIFTQENVIPIVIIGSGPAGLGAAIYGAAEYTTVIIEGENPGGLLMNTTDVANWGGKKLITGPEIIKDLREQVAALGGHFVNDTVEKVDVTQWPFVLTLASGSTIRACIVGAFMGARPLNLNVPGEKEYWGSGVTACAKCDARFFKGQDVVVVGGGDSAVEEALQLANHAKKITILVRSDRMRASTHSQDRLKQYPNISIMYNVEIKRIEGNSGGKGQGGVSGVQLFNNKTKETFIMPTAGVFLAIGHVPNSEIFKGILDIDEHGYIKTIQGTHKTNIPGIVAAGEVADSRYRQAWSSGGRGTEAMLDGLAFLREIGFNPEIAKKLAEHEISWETTRGFEVPSITTFEQLKKEARTDSKPIMLDFWGEDCPACLAMLPKFKVLANKFKDSVKFFKINAEGELNAVSDLVVKYKIERIPTFILIKDGKEVDRFTGEKNRQELEEFLTKGLGKPAKSPNAPTNQDAQPVNPLPEDDAESVSQV